MSALLARPAIVIARASSGFRRSRAKLRDCNTTNFRGRPINAGRPTARTQMRRCAHRQDRLGGHPGVGGAGRVGDFGRHDRHAKVQAPEFPETTRPAEAAEIIKLVRAT